jgi:hypothetical protein
MRYEKELTYHLFQTWMSQAQIQVLPDLLNTFLRLVKHTLHLIIMVQHPAGPGSDKPHVGHTLMAITAGQNTQLQPRCEMISHKHKSTASESASQQARSSALSTSSGGN